MNMLATPIRIDTRITIDEVQARLDAAHARMGRVGRFAMTLSVGQQPEAYVTHWFRPEPHAFEDCRHVGSGTVSECLAAVERYAAEHATVPAIAAE